MEAWEIERERLRQEKLGKRLVYLLRYGAETQGLQVSSDGFVNLDELLKVPLLQNSSRGDVVRELLSSTSMRGLKRYEMREEKGEEEVRVTYGRRMVRAPCHEGTGVRRLLDQCVETVGNNIRDYDLSDCPDSYLLNVIMRQMRRKGQLTNKALRSFMGPTLYHISFWDLPVNEGTLKTLARCCPNLEFLCLRECTHIVTDHLLSQILKKFPKLQSLHLLGCKHVTGRTLETIARDCPSLRHLNLTFIRSIAPDSLLSLIHQLPSLEELNFYDYKGFKGEWKEKLNEAVADRNIRVEVAGAVFGQHDPTTPYDSPWEKPNFR